MYESEANRKIESLEQVPAEIIKKFEVKDSYQKS